MDLTGPRCSKGGYRYPFDKVLSTKQCNISFPITYSLGSRDLRGGCKGCPHPPPPPPRDDLRFSNTTGILQKKTMWFIGVEVEQETSAPPPKNNPGCAPGE